jgi:hypothetical protein
MTGVTGVLLDHVHQHHRKVAVSPFSGGRGRATSWAGSGLVASAASRHSSERAMAATSKASSSACGVPAALCQSQSGSSAQGAVSQGGAGSRAARL